MLRYGVATRYQTNATSRECSYDSTDSKQEWSHSSKPDQTKRFRLRMKVDRTKPNHVLCDAISKPTASVLLGVNQANNKCFGIRLFTKRNRDGRSFVDTDESLDKSLFQPLSNCDSSGMLVKPRAERSENNEIYIVAREARFRIKDTQATLSQSLLFCTEPELSLDPFEDSFSKECSKTKFETKATPSQSAKRDRNTFIRQKPIESRPVSQEMTRLSKTTAFSWVKKATGKIAENSQTSPYANMAQNFSWKRTISDLPPRNSANSHDSLPEWRRLVNPRATVPVQSIPQKKAHQPHPNPSRVEKQKSHFETTVPLPGGCRIARYNSKERPAAHQYAKYVGSRHKPSRTVDLKLGLDSYFQTVRV